MPAGTRARDAGREAAPARVGEGERTLQAISAYAADLLPKDRPRYLMGVGRPEDMINAIRSGFDMFDCVMPTRNARNGNLFTSRGRLNIKNARYKDDQRPLDEDCACPTCKRYSRAYIHHLNMSGEILASILSTVHNISFYLDMMKRIRQAISLDAFTEFLSSYTSELARGVD